MIKRSMKEEAFDTLSIQAQLYIQLEDAKTDQEKFIKCIRIASTIAKRKSLGKVDEITDTNLKVIMQLIKSYLDSGVHPDSTENNLPAIFYALTYPELVKLLLARGANPDLQSNAQSTALHWVAMFFHSFYVENLFVTAELLAAAGADINAQDERGKKPIELIKKTFILSKSKISKIEARFQNITENPRGFSEIPTSKIERSPYSDLQLTEHDHAKIRLFREKKYKELIDSDPTHIFVAALGKPFWRHKRERNNKILTFEGGGLSVGMHTRKP